MEATYKGPGDSINYTPAAAVAAGEVIVQGDLIGIAAEAIAASKLGSLKTRGHFEMAKAAVDMLAGHDIYWDEDNNVVTTTAGGNLYFGKTTAAAAAADATVAALLLQGRDDDNLHSSGA